LYSARLERMAIRLQVVEIVQIDLGFV